MNGDRLLLAVAWLVPGIVALLLNGAMSDPVLPLQILSCLSILFGMWAFWSHGGPQVTAAGLFSAASAVFVGYSGLWWVGHLNGDVPRDLVAAATGGYFVTVAAFFTFWWDTRAEPVAPMKRDVRTALWATNVGIWLTAAALTVDLVVSGTLSYLTEDAAFVGIVLATLGLTGARRDFRVASVRTLAIAALLGWYVLVAFDGFGRLPVIALGAAVATAVSFRLDRRTVKLVSVGVVPLAAGALTALRWNRLDVATPSGAESGPDSDVGGLWTFARLIGHEGMEPAFGETFLTALVVWIPRSWWPEKPLGFGTELTALLEPQYLPLGHSMVATAFGEWHWNFGWWGMPLMVMMVGMGVRWLDQWRARVAASPLDSRRAILIAVLGVSLVASMTDFVWGGTFNLAARMLVRVGVIAGLVLLWGTKQPPPTPRRDPPRRRRRLHPSGR